MAYLSVNIETTKNNKGLKLKDITDYFKALNDNVISVGIHKDKGREIVKRAAHTEFGTTKFEPWETPFGIVHVVPPRPAIRMTLYPEMKEIISANYKDTIDVEKNLGIKNGYKSANSTQSIVGQVAVGLQKDKMENGGYDQSTNDTGLDPEHNGLITESGIALKTIGYKGFDDPWIQTRATINSVDYKVEKRK